VRKLFVLLAGLAILGAAASCETLNIGPNGNPNRFVVTGVSFSTNTPVAGSDVTATINFQGVSGPFNFTVTFGDCVTPATQTVTAPNGATSATLTFTLDSFLLADDPDGKDCSVSVTGTDALGVIAPAVSGTFHVSGIPNQPPTIATAFNAGDCSVTATVADPDNDDPLNVSITTPGTGVNTPAAQNVTGGSGTATFFFNATDIIAGANTPVTFTVNDNKGGTATSTVTVVCDPFPLVANTLYAIPDKNTVAVGEPVLITVYTGELPNPFQYATGVRVTFPTTAGGDYVDDSFNVGVPGGDADHPDGVWGNMDLVDGDFLLATDSFYKVTTDLQDGDPLIQALDFNVTPLDGNDLSGADTVGALLNFQMNFANAGTVPLRFQQFFTVNRTYYQDGTQSVDYFWSDITNDHPGANTTITVQ
jgi:hypothetical protein